MRCLLLLFVLWLGAAHSVPLNLTALPSNDIVRGTPATFGQFPYMAFIEPSCTGILISHRHVLAHEYCIRDAKIGTKVHFGVTKVRNLNEPGQIHNAVRAARLITKGDEPTPFRYSVGIIELETAIVFTDNIKPTYVLSYDGWFTDPANKLPSQTISYGWVLNHGIGDPKYNYLSYADVSILEGSACSAKFADYDNQKGICSGRSSPGDQLSYYDNGAPLLVRGNLVGLAATQCNGNCMSGFFVRLAPICFEIEEAVGSKIGC